MSAVPNTNRIFSIEEYLTLERNATSKSEWIDGAIIAMSGGTPDHSRIAKNIIRLLDEGLEDSPCEVFTSDLLVGIRQRAGSQPFLFPIERERGLYGYPDLSVVCGDLEFHDKIKDVVTNPTLVVEVLSPTTERHDREWKLPRYKAIPSLREILFVHATRSEVEHYYRDDAGDWTRVIISGLEASISLRSVEVTLPLARIYRRVTLIVE